MLNNKAPTWNNLQKGNKQGPRRCPLCKVNEETNWHLIMTCPYAIQVRQEVGNFLGFRNIWKGISIEGLRRWCENVQIRKHDALPLFIARGI